MQAFRTSTLSDKGHRMCARHSDERACLIKLDYMCKTTCNHDDMLYADVCCEVCTRPDEDATLSCAHADSSNERLRCTSALSYDHIAGGQTNAIDVETEYMYGLPRKAPMVWVT